MKINPKKIERIRADKRLSSKEIARRYGCTSTFINMLVKQDTVRMETAIKLADAMQVDLYDFAED